MSRALDIVDMLLRMGIFHRPVVASTGGYADKPLKVLYKDEVCPAGTCLRPPGHSPPHSSFDGPEYPDQVLFHDPEPDPQALLTELWNILVQSEPGPALYPLHQAVEDQPDWCQWCGKPRSTWKPMERCVR